MDEKKVMLCKEIESLLSFGASAPEISQELLRYLSVEELESIVKQLKTQSGNLKESDKKWLKQFRKES